MGRLDDDPLDVGVLTYAIDDPQRGGKLRILLREFAEQGPLHGVDMHRLAAPS